MDDVIWHDVECGAYAADLPLWRRLAADAAGPVLDLGAGTGRVALDLARAGHEVWALDVEPVLLDALAARAGDLPVHPVAADARDFDLGRRFGLVLAPMQTLQLLDGPDGRASCLRAVRRHLVPGGTFAAAIAPEVDAFDADDGGALLLPDVREVEGVVFSSRPVAVRSDERGFVLERLRERVGTDGGHVATQDRIRLDRLDAATLEAEGRAAGLEVAERLEVDETPDHVGSDVVVLRAPGDADA